MSRPMAPPRPRYAPPCRRTRRYGAAGDEGTVLILVLAFVAFLGVVLTALLGYIETSFKVTSVARDIEQRTAAADGAAKWALNRLIEDPANCDALGTPPAVNGHTATVTCASRIASVLTDSTGWGVYIDDPAGQIATQSAGGPVVDRHRIEGPIYMDSVSNPWDLKANLVVAGGGVLQRTTASGCNPGSADFDRIVIQGAGSFACTPPVRQPEAPRPTQPLPSSPALLGRRSSSGDGNQTCRVFQPGWYDQRPDLVAQNYFAAGVYFFEHGVGDIAGKDVLGGGVSTTETAVIPDLATMDCAKPDDGGVQFIIGTDGYLFAHNNARVELHSNATADVAGTTIYRLRASDPAPWSTYAALPATDFTSGGFDRAVLRAGQGGNASLVVHGLVYVPGGSIDLEGKNTDVTQIRGGVVTAGLRLQAAANLVDPGLRISAGEQFTTTQYVIRASVPGDGKPIEVAAVLRFPKRRPADPATDPVIYSWVVF